MFFIKKAFIFILLTGLFSCTKNLKTLKEDCSKKKDKKCGSFYRPLHKEPESLHPISSVDVYSRQVQYYVLESLMRRNLDTYEWEAYLAKSYEKKGNSYIFHLRKNVFFHDGSPLRAKDVAFSYKAIMNPEFKALALYSYFENVKSVKVLSPYKVKFDFKKKYFKNFDVLAGMPIIPEHFYKDPKKRLNKVLIGSGPYLLKKYKRGRNLILEKNKNWWALKNKKWNQFFNFNRIYIRFISDDNMRLEMLKKNQVDFTYLSSEQYVKRSSGDIWGKKVFKKEVSNKIPKGYGFVAFNLKKDLFKSVKVRRALAHLMNRKLIIEKLLYGKSLMATGPWYQQSPYANPKVKAIKFDPKKARKLLKEAGWKDSDKDGILDKLINGKRVDFKFSLLYANPQSEKYFTIFKEDLRKSGIVMKLQLSEWNSFLKILDSQKFDTVSLGWGGGSVHNDPKQIWHSSNAKPGASNFISYKNPKVDKLIDQGRLIDDFKKRRKIFQKIYKLIAEDVPYIFMFNKKFDHYGISQKIQMQKDTWTYSLGEETWWAF